MADDANVVVNFEASQWLIDNLDRLADYRTAANPSGGRVTRNDLLHEAAFGLVRTNMERTAAGGVRLRRPKPASATATG